MAITKLNCRVCNKEYEACKKRNVDKIFRWRDVACSIECGFEYLKRIELSRGDEHAVMNVEQIDSNEEHDEGVNEGGSDPTV